MRRSLRARAALGAVAVVGVPLVAGSVAAVLLTRSALADNVREAAELRAEDVIAALEDGGADPGDLAVEDDEDGFIQVVDDGEVVASSENVEGAPPLADLEDEESTVLDDIPVGDDRFLVVAVEEEGDTVIVGHALEDVDEAAGELTTTLAVLVPVTLLLVGLVAWRLVGRALAPVTALTTGAREIAGGDLGGRLPETASADELGELGRTLNTMLDRLQASRDRLAAFVADAAHELRSPVSGLRQHAEVALDHPGTTDVPELAGVVRSESLRLQRLVDDLLLLARSDEGALGRLDEAVDLDDVVAVVAGRYEPPPRLDRTAVSGGQVRGDPASLERLVTNLVDNARRHARTTVAVTVHEDDDGTVTLVVDDDGPGIPATDRERVFERFVRLDEARSRDAGGSGLGLAIVAAVARLHGGTVAIADSPLGGARVRVTFPGG